MIKKIRLSESGLFVSQSTEPVSKHTIQIFLIQLFVRSTSQMG